MKLPVSYCVVVAVVVTHWLSRGALAEPPPPPPPPEPSPLLEVYGTILPWTEFAHTTGATVAGTTGAANQVTMYSGANAPARPRMDMGTSNLGFRGGIELIKDKLSVIWQIESGVQADGATVANTVASRNSQIGVTGPWGTLFFGQWDTPYKWSTVATVNPIRGGFLADYNGLLDSPGFGVSSVTTQSGRVATAASPVAGPDAAFDRRVGNSIQYWTPTVAGLSARLAYSLYETRNAPNPMAPSIKPALFGASLAFDRGPFKFREALEVHLDYFGMSALGGSPGDTATNRSSTDFGNKMVAMFTTPVPGFETRVLGAFEYLQYKSRDSMMGAVNKFSRAALYGLVEQTLAGKHHLWLALGRAFQGDCEIVGGAACATTGLGATDKVLGYLYRASKSTDFYVAAYQIKNEASASYSTSPGLGGPTAPGADIESIGVGMLYTFSVKVSGGSSANKPPPPPAAPVAEPPPPPPVPVPGPTQEPGAVPSPAEPPPAEPAAPPPPAPAPPNG